VQAVVSAGDRVVAVGQDFGQDQLVAWTSTDEGNTWERAVLMEAATNTGLSGVVYNGTAFVALGGVDRDTTSDALAFQSSDGLTWLRQELPVGMHRVQTSLATRLGAVVAFVQARPGGKGTRPDQQCAQAWVLTGGAWHAEDLGCHGVASTAIELADGRIAAAYWYNLFLRPALT
jgi:hypothetical protein